MLKPVVKKALAPLTALSITFREVQGSAVVVILTFGSSAHAQIQSVIDFEALQAEILTGYTAAVAGAAAESDAAKSDGSNSGDSDSGGGSTVVIVVVVGVALCLVGGFILYRRQAGEAAHFVSTAEKSFDNPMYDQGAIDGALYDEVLVGEVAPGVDGGAGFYADVNHDGVGSSYLSVGANAEEATGFN